MHRIIIILQTMACAFCVLFATGCASDDDMDRPLPMKDDISGQPWNRPLPGESGQRFGGFPQSH